MKLVVVILGCMIVALWQNYTSLEQRVGYNERLAEARWVAQSEVLRLHNEMLRNRG